MQTVKPENEQLKCITRLLQPALMHGHIQVVVLSRKIPS